VASFIGGSIGIILMMLFSPLIAQIALKFGPSQFFALMLLGLVISSSAASDKPMNGYAMVAFGIALGLVGTDLESNVQRYTFGILDIWDGLSLTGLAIGLFGVTEVIATMHDQQSGTVDRKSVTLRALIPTREDIRQTLMPSIRGGLIGATTGSIPGTGGLIAAFVSYAAEKKIAKDPSRFGKGALEGVTGPESANNAADQAAFIPTLTLGIPGTPALALLLGVLLVHGMAPGPSFVNDKPEMFWGLVMSFWIGNIFLLVLNIPLVGVWVRILMVPQHILYPAVLFFIAIGAYTINTSAFDVGEVIAFGLLGYALRLLDLPLAPLILGFILGPPLEVQFRRTLTFGGGDFSAFVDSPLSASLLAISALIVVASLWSAARSRRTPIVPDTVGQ
jgi:TctA family transporter